MAASKKHAPKPKRKTTRTTVEIASDIWQTAIYRQNKGICTEIVNIA